MTAATQPHRHRCWVEIDLDAFAQNIAVVRERAGCELLAIVKANAYGHGAASIARALDGKAALLGVANLREAEEIEATKSTSPILLLGTCLPEEREAALRDHLQISISSVEEAAAWNELAQAMGVTSHAHVVIDTGMGRMGFPEAEWTETIVRSLLSFSKITWEGIASHLPTADEDNNFTEKQIQRFRKCVEIAHAGGLRPRWIHVVNSAGLLGYDSPQDFCNLARPGLAIYGVSPLESNKGILPLPLQGQDAFNAASHRELKPVLTWKTRVLQVRELPAGHGISYGRADKLTRPSLVATLACGYADGYPRQVSSKGAGVLIQGQRCPLLGRVTMDQIMVDVTGLATKPVLGDEAVLLGAQGDTEINVNELATLAGTIPWHIFTSITARVERVMR